MIELRELSLDDMIYFTNPVDSALLEESISIAGSLTHAEGYEARANFALAQLLNSMNSAERSKICRHAAESILRKSSTRSLPEKPSQEDYDRLVPWMLW